MSIKSVVSALSVKAKIIISVAALAVVGAVVAAVIILTGSKDAYRVLKVFELSGKAVISREGTGNLDAYVGMNLESGDTLTVADGSTMRISMDNDKYVQLEGGTVLELVAEGTAADSKTTIKLKKGTILNEITSSLTANSSYEVSTPKSTMAVRGTSFLVSVTENADGSYTTIAQVFHGKVEVTLIDSDGNPTSKRVIAPEDNCVIVSTVINEKTNNPAEKDGISFFVFDKGDGVYVEVPQGENPVGEIDYNKLSESIKNRILESNDTKLLVLSDIVAFKVRGYSEGAVDDSEETVPDETKSSETTTTETSQTTEETSETETTPTSESYTNTTAPVTAPPVTANSVTTASTTTKAPLTTATTEKTKTSATTESDEPTTSETKAPVTTTKTSKTTTKASETTTKTSETTTKLTSASTSIPTIYVPPTITTVPTGVITTTTVPTETTATTTTPEEEPEMFTVSFVCDGTEVDSVPVVSGGCVSELPAITAKTGHTAKWTLNGEEFTTNTPVTGNITVTASYTAIKYTVTFYKEDGTTKITTREVKYNEAVTDMPAFTGKTGYTGKWMNGATEFTSTTKVTENISVKEVYTINTYTVTFYKEDGTEIIDTREVKYNETVTDMPAFTGKTGYTGKWMNGATEFTSTTKVTDNISVKEVYTINTYTVTFYKENSTEIIATRQVKYNETVTDMPAFTGKTGYTGKWMNGATEFNSTTKVTENISVMEVYTLNTYTVTFNPNVGDPVVMTVAHGVTLTHDLKNSDNLLTYSQDNVPEGVTAETKDIPIVITTDDGNKYYLLEYDKPKTAITKNTTINLDYELYDSVYEVKVVDNNGINQHYLAKMGGVITLPVTEATYPYGVGYEFAGWGAVTSGGYANASMKVGSTDVEDSTTNIAAFSSDIQLYAPGEVTLTEDDNFYGYGDRNVENFKFVPVFGKKVSITFEINGVTRTDIVVYAYDTVESALKRVGITLTDTSVCLKNDVPIDNDSFIDQYDDGSTIKVTT